MSDKGLLRAEALKYIKFDTESKECYKVIEMLSGSSVEATQDIVDGLEKMDGTKELNELFPEGDEKERDRCVNILEETGFIFRGKWVRKIQGISLLCLKLPSNTDSVVYKIINAVIKFGAAPIGILGLYLFFTNFWWRIYHKSIGIMANILLAVLLIILGEWIRYCAAAATKNARPVAGYIGLSAPCFIMRIVVDDYDVEPRERAYIKAAGRKFWFLVAGVAGILAFAAPNIFFNWAGYIIFWVFLLIIVDMVFDVRMNDFDSILDDLIHRNNRDIYPEKSVQPLDKLHPVHKTAAYVYKGVYVLSFVEMLLYVALMTLFFIDLI